VIARPTRLRLPLLSTAFQGCELSTAARWT
jgi:hypothetical protein